ncbi:MAG: DUF6776 family protein [Lysobacterales bacterium]
MLAVGIALAWLATLALAWWLGADQAAPDLASIRETAAGSTRRVSELGITNDAAKRRIAVLERSDQVSRLANESLQKTLRVQEGDLAKLRDDLAFYQRLVGGETGRALEIQQLALRPIGRTNAFGFRVLLTRNARAGETNRGAVTVRVSGVGANKLVRLEWDRLQQETAATPLVYDFKYFQQLESSLILPAGFEPDRVVVRARASDGTSVEESFAWQAALQAGGDPDVWQ